MEQTLSFETMTTEQISELLIETGNIELYNAMPDAFKADFVKKCLIQKQQMEQLKVLSAEKMATITKKARKEPKAAIHTNAPRKAVKELINALRKISYHIANKELFEDDNIANAVELYVATFNSGHAESKAKSRNLGETAGWKIENGAKVLLTQALTKILNDQNFQTWIKDVPYPVSADSNTNSKEKLEAKAEQKVKEAETTVLTDDEIADAIMVSKPTIETTEEPIQLEMTF